MTAAYLIIYDGEPDDPVRFVEYYESVHVPIVEGFPGILGVDTHVRTEGPGPFLVTRLLFRDVDELHRAVDGPYRSVTRRDMDDNILPHFTGTVRHLVTEVHEWRSPGGGATVTPDASDRRDGRVAGGAGP